MKSFGQKAPLTTTLRNVLRDYGSAQLLDEQLQNADDAGATECCVVLDVQDYGKRFIASKELSSWQGPALCFYDDAEFTSLDFESIQLVGDGKKRGDPTKTGQFGLGFNSSYHVTDVPMFLTKKRLVIFDPHCENGLNGPGAMFEDLSGLTDQLAPFEFVYKVSERSGGTVFRFPLRQAGSKIKKEPTCPEECWREVVEPFLLNMKRRLLFLKHVKKIRVFRGTRLVATAVARRPQTNAFWQTLKDVVAAEPYDKAMTKKKVREKIPKLIHHRLELSDGECDGENWLIVTAFGDEKDVARGLKLNLMPYAAVAVPLFPLDETSGLIYASLPTPVRTGLPIHVDGRFEVTRDRNALRVSRAAGKGGKDEAVQRADWNTRVMSKVVASAYAKAAELVDQCILPDWVWADDSAFGAAVSNQLYETLIRTSAPVFDGKSAQDVLFREKSGDDVVVVDHLRQAGCPIVASPAPYDKTVGRAFGAVDRLLSPKTTAAWLKVNRPQMSHEAAIVVFEYLAPLSSIASEQNPLVGLPIVPVSSSKVVEYGYELLTMGDKNLGGLLTPALEDRIVDDRCARFFKKPLEAADVVEANLPSEWCGRPFVTTASPIALEWIRKFWTKVSYKKIKGTACCEWPLLPCAGGEVVSLNRIGLVMLPSSKDDNQDLAIAALNALGVAVADLDALESWTELSDDAAKLSASAVVEATVRLCPTEAMWNAIGSEARDALLAAIATTEFDEATAEKLAALPLFAYASTSQRRPMPPARDERFFENESEANNLLPSTSQMLARPRDANVRSLYERLGAQEGTLVAFWLSRLDDRWRQLDVVDRLRLLKQLRRDLEVACDSPLPKSFGSQSFAEWLGSKPLLWTNKSDSFIAIRDALDPREPLNSEFWPDKLVPSDDLPLDEWLPFLLRAGMTPGISKVSVLRAARIADSEQSLDRARLVVSALFQQPAATEDTEWLQELGRLRIAEPRYTLPGKRLRLVTFAGNVLPVVGSQREHASCWSQRTVVSSGGFTPRVTTIRGLGAAPNAALEDVAKHLLYLTSNANSLETLFRASDRLNLRDQIGCCYDSLGYLVTTTAEKGGARALLDLIRDVPICMLRGRQRAFARSDRIFPALNGDEDAPPYLYSLDERADDDLISSIARYPLLKDALGIQKGKPTLQRLEELSAELGGKRLDIGDDERGIKAAAQLGRLAFKYHHAVGTVMTMYLPDTTGLCRLATDTVYDDAPWLEDRVDKRKLPLVHPSLERKVVEALGAEPMSTAVVELPGQVVVGKASRDAQQVLDAWQTTLRSPAFVASLRRASTAARNGGRQQAIDAARLAKIRKARLVPATTLRSRFVYRKSVDCSAGQSSSSPALILDKGEEVLIYVLVDEGRPGWRRRWRASVATVLDRYLDRAVGDRALIGELLSVDDVDEMAHVLDAYEIPSLELDMRLGSAPVGLDDNDRELASLEDSPNVGDIVVYNGVNVKIVELRSNEFNEVLVATSPDLSEIESVSRSSLRRVVRKQSEQMLAPAFDSENERMAREAIVRREQNAVLEPEPTGIDDVAYEQLVNSDEAVDALGGSAVTKKTRVSPGFDLVRVGTFGKSDVIFFHHRMTLAELYDENRNRRQRLVKECCCVLDDVAGVFGYDPAKVALFYQRGVVSRFVSQKLYFNLAPIEARRQGDARTDPFTYCYFWGLFVHKLSHFFDIVHGTRHDFFQTEYRSHFALNFIALLLARGFDPSKVEAEFGELIHQEVF